MSSRSRNTYQFEGGLEQALIDVCSVAASGNIGGVRQLATRILRALPPEIRDPEQFRDALTAALAETGALAPRRASQPPADRDSRIELVDVRPPPAGVALIVPDEAASQLQAVVREWSAREELVAAGVSPTLTLLLKGPPGVGKTHAAQWLAEQLDLPLFAADLAGVVSSYLGSTGRNLRRVLDYAKEQPCVLLLDEFDALAKRRDDDSDVGELKRIVNVLLLELERWPSNCLLVAATNHPELLDRAVERRFDRIIDIPPPGPHERIELFRIFSDPIEPLTEAVLVGAAALTPDATGSYIERAVNEAARNAIIHDKPLQEALTAMLLEAFDPSEVDRDAFCLTATESLGMTQREIARLLDVSHPTVGAAIRRAREAQ